MSNEVMTRNSEWMNHIVNHLKLALTKGGPGTASNSVTLQIYKEAFSHFNLQSHSFGDFLAG